MSLGLLTADQSVVALAVAKADWLAGGLVDDWADLRVGWLAVYWAETLAAL